MESLAESVLESVLESVAESVLESVLESVAESVLESVLESVVSASVAESFGAPLLMEDLPRALPRDYDRLIADPGADAAFEHRAPVLDAFHEFEDPLVAEGLLTVCGVYSRESSEVIDEQAGVVYEEIGEALFDQLFDALVDDLLEVCGLHLVVLAVHMHHLESVSGKSQIVFLYLAGVVCDDVDPHVYLPLSLISCTLSMTLSESFLHVQYAPMRAA